MQTSVLARVFKTMDLMAAEARRSRGGRRDSDGPASESEAEEAEEDEDIDHDERRTAKALTTDEVVKPKRVLKPRAKLDADRCDLLLLVLAYQKLNTLAFASLLSEYGFRYLCRTRDSVRLKGRGQELGDLARLIKYYDEWAHQLFPRLPLRDFCLRVEDLTTTKNFKVSLLIEQQRGAFVTACRRVCNGDGA